MSKDHYTLLGLQRDASLDEIKRAYRQLAMRHHPDRTQNNPQDTEIFKAVAVAFATLSNPEKRAEYDRLLATTDRRASQATGTGDTDNDLGSQAARPPLSGISLESFSRDGINGRSNGTTGY